MSSPIGNWFASSGLMAEGGELIYGLCLVITEGRLWAQKEMGGCVGLAV